MNMKIKRVLSGVASVAFVAACLGAAASSRAADLVRYVQKTKSGDYEERTMEGTAKAFTPQGVEFEYDSKGKTESRVVSPELILWLQFDDEPLELSTARVELQVGNYEEALAKLGEVAEGALPDDVAAELAWNRAYATAMLAQADAGKSESGASALKSFVETFPTHYRFYEANALLADLARALGRGTIAEKYYGALDDAEADAIKARGKLGRAELAFEKSDWESARALFTEVAQTDGLDARLEGLNAQTNAKIGLARVDAKDGKLQDAEQALNALLESTPNGATLQQARIYNALGDVYAESEKPQEAIVAYLHVDLLYPAARAERVKALKALVGLWRQVGRADRASETIRALRDRFNVDVE